MSSDQRHRLAQRLHRVPPTIFAEMSRLAVETGSVNLGQGFPDDEGPSQVVESAVEALRSSRNQYAPGVGVPELREAVAGHQQRFYGLDVSSENVLVTTGATEALTASILALVNPGDEVLVFEPYFDSYPAACDMAGARRVAVTLEAPDFRIDLDAVRAAVTERTRVMILNTPHNPTGMVATDDELRGLAEIAVEHDLIVISDEVYEHLVFDGLEHHPIAGFPGMHDRTLTVSSGGKTFSFTGWKVGWVVGNPDLLHCVMLAKQFMSFTSGAPLQPAIAGALGLPDEFFTQIATDLQAKRDRLQSGLTELGFELYPSSSTYFCTTDIAGQGYADATEYCQDIAHDVGVVAIPHASFYDHPDAGRTLVRWAFCKRDGVIDEALDRLSRR